MKKVSLESLLDSWLFLLFKKNGSRGIRVDTSWFLPAVMGFASNSAPDESALA